ncbi:transcription termination factor 1 [Varanus komodoensis]|uniref:Myb-like domain-containing protein n=1 Tax=Varanus komodoensis TaxID=61221 RepID=A0A8D2KRS3_VARKO|nr:transcription termination factor 1 [Varanus komodoensis]XP_044295977.1 transcription termination factor 1 [Varanus komodoensis]XP_044295978.1 transcription termination factor 1 [Varanus komodoensis]XP_044295979.1 transcription termination factor 1 [Varanus komodoensis]
MPNMANSLSASDFVPKKKKKLGGRERSEAMPTPFLSPVLFDHSSFPSETAGNEDVENSKVCVKKSKKRKKECREGFDSQLVPCSVVEQSELDIETGVDVSLHKKKKKKKHKHSEEDVGDKLYVAEMPEQASNSPKEDNLRNMDCIYESTPLKRKRKKMLDGGESGGPAENQDVEDGQIHAKKSKKKKKKASRERSDSQFVPSSVGEESELNSGTGTDISLQKKKKTKKKKHNHSKQGDGDQLYVTEMPEQASNPPKEDSLENIGCIYESALKKKRKKKKSAEIWLPEQAEASGKFWGDRNGRKNSKKTRKDPSDTVGMQVDVSASLISSSTVQLSDLSQEEKHGVSDTEVKKQRRRKHKKASQVNGLDGASNDLMLKQEQDSLLQAATSEGADGSPSPLHPDEEEASEAGSLDHQDLEAAAQELEEFIPHVRSLAFETVRQLACRDLARFRKFKEQGIAVKFGPFSQKENDLLKRNIENFLEESGIESAEKLLFSYRFPEEKAAINKLKSERLFGVKIAEGIPRPWRHVYYRARKMFDPQNYSGKYTEEEKKKLKAYQAIHGNNWKKISQLMTRSSHSVAWKFSLIKDETNCGPWSREETNSLVRAVEEALRSKVKRSNSAREKVVSEQALTVTREDLYKGIPWSQIEAKVQTRNWRQCKQRWLSIVTQRMSRGRTKSQGYENLHFKINLIERLYELKAEDSSEINWEELSDVIGNVPPSYIQSRFYKMKVQYVPSWKKKDFPEIIDYLYKETLPKLKEVYEKRGENQTSSRQEETFKTAFQFSDIFQRYNDEDILLSEEDDE